jgi:hypothetical protein
MVTGTLRLVKAHVVSALTVPYVPQRKRLFVLSSVSAMETLLSPMVISVTMATTLLKWRACQLQLTVRRVELLNSAWLVELLESVLLATSVLNKLTRICLTFPAKLTHVPRDLIALKVPKHPSDALSDFTPSNWELNSYLSVQTVKLDITVIMISLNLRNALKELTVQLDLWSQLTVLAEPLTQLR